MKLKALFSFAALLAFVLGSFTNADAQQLKIKNGSSYDIEYIYVSSSTDSSWGDDRLGSGILYSGGTTSIFLGGADYYDIKLIDEDGDECVMFEIWLDSKVTWNIENDELLECMGY